MLSSLYKNVRPILLPLSTLLLRFFPLLVRTDSIGTAAEEVASEKFSFLAGHAVRVSSSLSSARAFSLLEMHCSSLCRRLCFCKRNGIPMPAENRFPRRNTDGSNACFFFKNRFRIIRRTINYFLKILSLLFILNSLSLFFSYSIHDIHEPKNLLRHAKC